MCDGGCAIITKQDVSRVVNSGIDLKSLIENALPEYEPKFSSLDCSLFNCMLINKDLADSIVKKVECIETELNLLNDFGIWDEVCSSKVEWFWNMGWGMFFESFLCYIKEHHVMCKKLLEASHFCLEEVQFIYFFSHYTNVCSFLLNALTLWNYESFSLL